MVSIRTGQAPDPNVTLTIVGDDDQSIYAWRGARPENLNELSVDFPTLKVISSNKIIARLGSF